MTFFTLLKKEVKSYLRWKEWIIGDVVAVVLSFFGILVVWSSILAGGFGEIGMLRKETYVLFLFCGSLISELLHTAAGHAMSHTFREELHERTFYMLYLSKINPYVIALAKLGIPIARLLLRSVFLLLIGTLLFGVELKASFLLILPILILFFFSTFCLGITIASLALWRHGIAQISWMMVSIFSLLGGMAYPIEILPTEVRAVSLALPPTHAVIAMRKILILDASLFDVSFHLLVLLIFLLIAFPLSLITYRFAQKRMLLVGL